MHRLILVKHSLPFFDSNRPANQWLLSDEGRVRCIPLAQKLAVWQPDMIYTSCEPKAVETGQIAAAKLGLPCETWDGLHEHERSRVGPLSQEAFEASVNQLFEQPNRLVFGEECADEAHMRFSRALNTILEASPVRLPVIVAHGTVISLFVARACGVEPFPFWKNLTLPSFVVLSLPGFEIEAITLFS